MVNFGRRTMAEATGKGKDRSTRPQRKTKPQGSGVLAEPAIQGPKERIDTREVDELKAQIAAVKQVLGEIDMDEVHELADLVSGIKKLNPKQLKERLEALERVIEKMEIKQRGVMQRLDGLEENIGGLESRCKLISERLDTAERQATEAEQRANRIAKLPPPPTPRVPPPTLPTPRSAPKTAPPPPPPAAKTKAPKKKKGARTQTYGAGRGFVMDRYSMDLTAMDLGENGMGIVVTANTNTPTGESVTDILTPAREKEVKKDEFRIKMSEEFKNALAALGVKDDMNGMNGSKFSMIPRDIVDAQANGKQGSFGTDFATNREQTTVVKIDGTEYLVQKGESNDGIVFANKGERVEVIRDYPEVTRQLTMNFINVN